MSKNVSVLQEITRSQLFVTSLAGVRTLFEKEFEIDNILISTSEAIKTELVRKQEKETGMAHIQFPYAYLELNDVTAIKDHYPNKVVKRHGYRLGNLEATFSTTKKAYIFPVTVSLAFKYVDNDPYRALNMVEAMLVLGQIGGMKCFLEVGQEFMLTVAVDIPDSATIPIAQMEDEHAPGAQEITLDFLVHTWVGFFRDVSAVSSDRPNINVSFDAQELTTVEHDGQAVTDY